MKSSFGNLKLVVFDFDGVLTDMVHVTQDGSESVVSDRGDGLGIAMLNSDFRTGHLRHNSSSLVT